MEENTELILQNTRASPLCKGFYLSVIGRREVELLTIGTRSAGPKFTCKLVMTRNGKSTTDCCQNGIQGDDAHHTTALEGDTIGRLQPS